jgi:hypothetical protein
LSLYQPATHIECEAGYAVALSEPQKLKVRDFLKNIDDPNVVPPLYRHQAEAVKRIIYSYEILGKKDLLVEVVTGGGKSAIIAGAFASAGQIRSIASVCSGCPQPNPMHTTTQDNKNPAFDIFLLILLIHRSFKNSLNYICSRTPTQEPFPPQILGATLKTNYPHPYPASSRLAFFLIHPPIRKHRRFVLGQKQIQYCNPDS